MGHPASPLSRSLGSHTGGLASPGGSTRPKASRAAALACVSTALPALATVSGFVGASRAGNGEYRERLRAPDSPYFEKPGGAAFIYRVGETRWCIGPSLDGVEVVWAERECCEKRLRTCKSESWNVKAPGAGRPVLTLVRSCIKVYSANGLRSADLDASSDPYCIGEVATRPNLAFKTQVVKKCLAPFWNEEFDLDGIEIGDTLQFQIMDWDPGDVSEHDPIGNAKLQVLPGGYKGELGLTLRGRKAGAVRIEVQLPPPEKAAPSRTQGAGFGAIDTKDPKQLLAMLHDGGPEDAVRAAGALETLALEEDARSALLASGAVQALVLMLSGPTAMEGRCRAAGALTNLASAGVCRRVISTAGALPPLLDLLSDGSWSVKEEAAGVLLELASLDRARKEMLAAGCLPHVISLLLSGTIKGPTRAARLLACFASSPEVAARIVRQGALPSLVELLVPRNRGEAAAQAALALATLAGPGGQRKAVVNARPLPALIGLLSAPGTQLAPARAQAAGAIAALAAPSSEEAAQAEASGERGAAAALVLPDAEAILAAGALPPLVRVLQQGGDCAEQACVALSRLASVGSPPIVDAIMATGALHSLLALLCPGSYASSKAQAAAIATLRELARSEKHQRSVEAAVPQGRGRERLLATLKQDVEQSAEARPSSPKRRVMSSTLTRAGSELGRSCSASILGTTASSSASGALGATRRFAGKPHLHRCASAGAVRSPVNFGIDLRFVRPGATFSALARTSAMLPLRPATR